MAQQPIEDKSIPGVTPKILGWFMGTFVAGTFVVAGIVVDSRIRIEMALLKLDSRIERLEDAQKMCSGKMADIPVFPPLTMPMHELIVAVLPKEENREL